MVCAIAIAAASQLSASALVDSLHPDATVSNTQWNASTNLITDVGATDGVAITHTARNLAGSILYSLGPSAGTGTINSVTLYVVAKRTGTRSLSVYPVLGGTAGTALSPTLTTVFASYSAAITRPGGGAWSWADIDALQVRLDTPAPGANGTSVDVDEVYVQVNYTPPASTLTVAQGTDSGRPTTTVFGAQASTKAVDELTLTAANGPMTVTGITVRGLDTVGTLQTDVSGVRLYVDDNDGLYDAGDTQLGTTQTFSGQASGSTATFSGLTQSVAVGTPVKVWIVYTLGATSVDGHIVGSQVNNGDVTATGGTVNTFTTITSSFSAPQTAGQTVKIDATAPSANTSDPLDNAVLTGTAKTISGTASDGTGSGLASVQVRIARSDGQYWTGAAWSGTETWVAASGTTNWTYAWSPLDSQNNGPFTYTVTARATDGVGLVGTDPTPITGVKIDNVGPTLLSATAPSATQVDAVFSEALQGGSIAAGDFTIAGLTVSAATLDANGTTVHITTSAQTANQAYTVSCSAGNVLDTAGNGNTATTANFTGYTPPADLTVFQGADVGRPTTKIYRLQSAANVVDQLGFTAQGGTVTISQIVVRGLDTVGALQTDVTAVRLFRDNGATAGQWDGSDTQLGTTQTFSGQASGSTATFSGLGRAIAAGTTEKIWVVYTIGASAVDGHIVGSQVNNGDVTATGGTVNAFTTITSAGSGQTIQVDATAPSANTSDPLDNAVLTGSSKTISGTASDGTGSGVTSVQVRIARSDGQYWTGAAWSGTETWVAASGTTNWTYAWSPLDSQNNGPFTYTVTARATDGVGLVGTDPTPVTGLKVDNVGPTLVSATAPNTTQVDAVFSEALQGGSIAPGDFTIAGLTVSAATLDANGTTVHITTSAQTANQAYTLSCSAGNVLDTAGNGNTATTANFTGYAPPGVVNVTQGSDSGRPAARVFRARGAINAVDELVLAGTVGPTTISQIVVRGLDTVGALQTDVTAVRLFRDNGATAGQWDGSDTQLGTTQTFSGQASGSTATFSALGESVPAGTTEKIWVVYTIGASAVDGHIVGSQVNNGDITASAGSVNAFAAITSANTGQTIEIDAAPPVANTSDPLDNAVLIGTSKTISGTASDGTGSGVTAVAVRIARSDGQFWTGTGWGGTATWNAASGTTNWTYAWSPLDSQNNGPYTYTITARATDGVGQTYTDATPATGIKVDSIVPALVSASAPDSTHVDVVFSEEIQPGSVSAADFVIPGLTVSDAVVLAGNTQVHLTTTEQIASRTYTVQCAAGAVLDVAGNQNDNSSTTFTGWVMAADTQAPTVPSSVTAVSGVTSPTVATVSWGASSDNIAVVGYRIRRALSASGPFTAIDTTISLTWSDTTGISGQKYYYTVTAFDGAGNESATSTVAGPVHSTWANEPHGGYSSNTDYCNSCHVPHVAAATKILRSTGATVTTEVSICYNCHDGRTTAFNVQSGADNSFALASGHAVESTATGGDLTNTCSACHSLHRDRDTYPGLPRATVNSSTVTGNNNTWCEACHNNANAWYGAGYPSLSAPTRDATGYPVLGTFPGATVYNNPAANAHASIPASATADRAQGACLYCHVAHRGPNGYDGLSAIFRPTTASTLATDQANGEYAQSCFVCHGGVLPSELTTLPVNIKQYVTASGQRAGHRIKTAGGTLPVGAPLPCYDCHNPHGSTRGNASEITDVLGRNLTTSGTAEQTRQFCFSCHASSDAKTWDSVSATYVAVSTTATVEGLHRDGSDGAKLKLPSIAGHASDDPRSCGECHGQSYDPAGFNVHNPGTGPNTTSGQPCFDCHPYQSMQGTTTYHHYMASDAATPYPAIADPTALSGTDGRRTCLMCHVDHDYFDSSQNSDPAHTKGRAQNLRSSVSVTPDKSTASTYVNYDFSDAAAGDGGVCVSCHKVQMTKNTTGRKSDTDRSTVTIPVKRADYSLSAHNYIATAPDLSTMSNSTTFTADSSGASMNCVKCHNDTTEKAYQTGPYKFALHDSTIQSSQTDAGQAGVGADPQESACYICHSRAFESSPNNPNGGSDYVGQGSDLYGGGLQMGQMTGASLNVKGMMTVGGSSHPVAGDGTTTSRVECVNCHNVHKAEFSLGFGGLSGVVQNPDNTLIGSSTGGDAVYAGSPSSGTDHDLDAKYCLKCHDGTTPAAINNGTAYIPYSVFIAPADAALANKSTYRSRSHFNAVPAETAATAETIVESCPVCHDKHASQLPKLLGVSTVPGADPTIAGNTVTANDVTVCLACHSGPSTNFPAGEAQRRADGYLMSGTWPGFSGVYDAAYSSVTHSGNGHLNAQSDGLSSSLPSSYAAGDCKICHDVHGTANPYDETRLAFGASDFTLCFDCHDGAPASSNIKQYYPASAGGTNAGSNAGHKIQTSVAGAKLAVGQAMPCYDCHNPHGSKGQFGLQVRDIGDAAGEVDVSTDAGVRKFCFTCHATSDTTVGWNGSAYVAVGTTTVEGIRRDGSDGSVLKLPAVSGHASGDLQSCYTCHGNDASNNPHNPSAGISKGGLACYTCHSEYQPYMEDSSGSKTGSSNSTVYHHVLGGAAGDGDIAPNAGSYQTSTSDVYCTSCHTDHNYFNGSKAGNLRSDATNSAGTPADTDYSTASNTGVCTSCHATSQAKQGMGTEQKADGSSATPKVLAGAGAGQYGPSAHNYVTTSTFGDASTFKANCSKCHNDENSPAYKQFQTSTNKFGTHWSAERRLLAALGGALTDPLSQTACFGCHTGGTAGNDYYGGRAMTQGARTLQQEFSLAYKHPIAATGGNSVECVNCHNPHIVTSTTGKVSDPANTYNTAAYSTEAEKAAYCLKCHSATGSLPAYTVNGTTYVPASVTIAAGDQAVMNKSTNGARGHWSAFGSISAGEVKSCPVCHAEHGSSYPRMLGAYDSATATNKINGVAITGDNNTVCSACHAAATTGFPNGSLDTSGYPTDGTWPGDSVYSLGYNATSSTGSMHNTANTVLPGKTYTGGDCKNCHDVHGTRNTRDELRTEDAAGNQGVLDFGPGNFTLCFDCHDTDGPAARNIKTYYPASVGGSAGGSGHEIKTAGGTLPVGGVVPCYDCHNPHGSASSSFGLTIVSQLSSSSSVVVGDGAGELQMSPAQQAADANNVRKFCFTCHTTADTTKGWNGASMVAVSAGAKVEGLDRTTSPVLHLPAIAGHNEGDTTSNCYTCHGNDYGSLSGNNVHNPSGGISTGGTDCYACHTTYRTYMEDGTGTQTGSSRANAYHHVLGGTISASYFDGDKAFAFGSFPTVNTEVFCLSCHVDHNQFNAAKSSNLRNSATALSPTASDTDYSTTSNSGVCTDCHATSITKQVGTDQKNDGSTATPKVVGGSAANQYGVSAHNYATTSSFDDATTFKANCSKCHNDENSPSYRDWQTSTNRFGTHWSAERRILSALGGALTDPLSETNCYGCHKGATAGTDFYGGQAMTQAARTVQNQFGLVSKHPVVAVGGNSVECVSCHNPHIVTTTTGKVSDPANTYNTIAYSTDADKTTFCLKCHSSAASLPSYTVNGTTYIPSTVTIAAGDQPLMNKSTAGARGHWSTFGSISAGETKACATCHDNHGSNYPKLIGAFDPATGTNKINGLAITGNNNSVCSACHTAGSTGYPGTTRDASDYPADGTWPGDTVYAGANGIHSGAVGSVVWPGSSYTSGDCKNCHDVHGSTNTYDELRSPDTNQSFSSTSFTLCFNCHDGAPSTKDVKRYYPTTVGGSATQAADTRFGHKTESAGTLPAGSALPCYDCHNPHGSGQTGHGLMVVTMTNNTTTVVLGDAANEINIGTASGQRAFCLSCHTTAGSVSPDTNPYGWNGSAYAIVGSGALVEGIDRTVYDSTNKRGLKLPPIAGHYRDDTSSCYDCHGNDYSGAATNNVHNPGPGGSSGGIDCLNCHGSTSTERYDRMVSDTSTYHHVLDAATPGVAPNTGTYPNSNVALACTSCHTDHNYFNSNKGANLRQGIGLAGSATANSDFSSAAPYGICISCHNISLAKNTTGQKSSSNVATADPSANTPAVTGPEYTLSAHNYTVGTSLSSGSSPFSGNCIKCHNDDQTKKYQPNSTTPLAIHLSSSRRILAALGYTGGDFGDPMSDMFCYKCHKSNTTAYAGNPNSLKDWYNIGTMNTHAQTVADTMFTTKILAVLAGATTVRQYDVATNTWGTQAVAPGTAPGIGANLVFHGGNFAYVPGAATTFQIMDPFGTPDANKTPATPKWLASGAAGITPVLPAALGAGGSLASDGVYLYCLRGGATLTTYRLDTGGVGANSVQVKSWQDAQMADLPAGFTAQDGANLIWAGSDYLYATTGGATTKVFQYKISTDTWNDANAADLPAATGAGASMVWAGENVVYAIRGGGTPTMYRGTIDSAGAITAWTTVAAVTPGNFGAGARLTWDDNKYLYALQGGAATGFWRYDTLNDSWTSMAVVPAAVNANSTMTAWQPSGHDSARSSNHRVDEEFTAVEGWMPSTNRHVNCADCHNVHQAKSGTHTVATTSIATKDLGGANEGVWGADYAPPTYTVGTASFTNGSATVNGSGTTWTAANGVYAGSWIQNNTDKHYYQIATVNSATQLTLSTTYKGATVAAPGTAYTLRLGYNTGTSATFTKGSKTVTGIATNWSTTTVPVGSYIRSANAGGWYRVVSVDSLTQITINDAYRTATYTGAYDAIRVAFTKVASGSVTRQYQLCFKCHTGYAWGTGTTPNGQSSGPWGRAWKQTDVAVDFDPVNYAYHPLFQRGRNQPPSTANALWDGTAGNGNKAATWSKGANPNTGLDNTFVDGWGTQSLVECTDCHDHPTPASGPEGPHGSSYRWLLHGLDPNVTVTLAGGAVTYPNRAGGTAGGTPYSATALCANCHRGDVYRVSASQYTASYNLGRLDHHAVTDGNCVPSVPQDADTNGTYWPNGCMNCHGGDTPGSLHGTSRGVGTKGDGATAPTNNTEMGKRFTNGSSWAGHELSDNSTANLGCYTIGTANDVSSCTQHGGSSGGAKTLNYIYNWE